MTFFKSLKCLSPVNIVQPVSFCFARIIASIMPNLLIFFLFSCLILAASIQLDKSIFSKEEQLFISLKENSKSFSSLKHQR